MSDPIDRSLLLAALNAWALRERPHPVPDAPIEYTAYDMQRMIYRTINDVIHCIEEQPDAQPDLRNNKLFRNNELQKTPETSDCYVRLSDLKKPIQRNPFDPEKGDIDGYMRYLKYNTDYTPLPCNYAPVVRCIDCEFWPYRKRSWYSKKIEYKSYPWCFHMDRGTGAGHCSKGERMKTDENQVL